LFIIELATAVPLPPQPITPSCTVELTVYPNAVRGLTIVIAADAAAALPRKLLRCKRDFMAPPYPAYPDLFCERVTTNVVYSGGSVKCE
jgi:hypothetical protein